MHSMLHETLFTDFGLSQDAHSNIQTIYPEDGWVMPGTEMPFYANSAHQEEKATVIPPSYSSVMPIDIRTMAPFASPSPTTIAQDISVSSGSSSGSSLESSWSNPTHWGRWPHSGILNLAGQGPSYLWDMSQESWDDGHNHVSQLCGLGLEGIPPGLGVTTSTTDVMDIRTGQGQHDTFYWDSLARRAVPKRQGCERPAAQILGQGGSDRRFTCPYDNCGKNFSGEWEKMRHIKSIHCPPTIGCRECNYKQSRKDLFSEHCKKRHPGRSIDDIMIQLDTSNE